MTGSLQIKITIRECVTPELFRAVSAVPNPRQRAALLKRLAEDALRSNVPTGQIAPAATSVVAGASQPAESGVAPRSLPPKLGTLISETGVLNEDRTQFDYGFPADYVSGARNAQTLRGVAELQHYVVTGTSSPRETVASIPVMLDYKARATNSVVGPTARAQSRKDGELAFSDTTTQPSRRRGDRMGALVAAALVVRAAANRFGRAIIGRRKKGGEDDR
ncbi:hypothetical protein AWB78_05948 [Caballeronia calidae]|uniref:Uncharacterized protein n=1 Tax=Caballeronia calidae TaxID=1777139 RepID=A0A158E3F3_9BURK|nr:hypothetical protein [Caballeronia calidae]SAL00457.1 hypothetical protein AWB78_05948 [Caballeronia calidae]